MTSPYDPPPPPLEGTFAGTPLPHLLLHALHEKQTGTLELTGKRAPAGTVLLVDGYPAKARTLEDHYLVPVLGQIGVLTKAQVERWLPELVAGEELHGRALVRKKVLTEDQVELGLHAQLARQMQSIVDLPPDTAFKFQPGIDALAGYGLESPVRLDPLPVAWASLKRQPPWPVVNATLARVTEAPLRVRAGNEPGRFGFQPAERAVLELLRTKPCRIDELLGVGSISAKEVDLLVYCLLIARQIEGVAEAAAPAKATPDRPAVDMPPRAPFQPLRSTRLVAVREEVAVGERSARRAAFVDPRAEVESEVPAASPPPARVVAIPPAAAVPSLVTAASPPPDDVSPFDRRTLAPPASPLEADEPDLDFPLPGTPTQPPPEDEFGEEVHTRPTVERMVAVTDEAVASYVAQQAREAAAKEAMPPAPRGMPAIPPAPRAPVRIDGAVADAPPGRRKSASDRPTAPGFPAATAISISPETPRVEVEPEPPTRRAEEVDGKPVPEVTNEFDTGWDDL